MIATVSLLISLALSLLFTRIAAMALMLTGMSHQSAKFQATSAFTGVGYTTSEAEKILNHPVRRRIVTTLMYMGNIVIATVIATMMLAIGEATEAEASVLLNKLLILTGGVIALWILAVNKTAEKYLNVIIAWTLKNWGGLSNRDYFAIIQFQDGYIVSELLVEQDSWMVDQSLIQLELKDEGIMVLGIRRLNGEYLGTPKGDMLVHEGDTLMLYGAMDRIEKLDHRQIGEAGDQVHKESIAKHKEELQKQIEINDQMERDQQK